MPDLLYNNSPKYGRLEERMDLETPLSTMGRCHDQRLQQLITDMVTTAHGCL